VHVVALHTPFAVLLHHRFGDRDDAGGALDLGALDPFDAAPGQAGERSRKLAGGFGTDTEAVEILVPENPRLRSAGEVRLHAGEREERDVARDDEIELLAVQVRAPGVGVAQLEPGAPDRRVLDHGPLAGDAFDPQTLRIVRCHLESTPPGDELGAESVHDFMAPCCELARQLDLKRVPAEVMKVQPHRETNELPGDRFRTRFAACTTR
jgi:hypothetical protein